MMSIASLLAYFYWDPDREFFTIPFTNHPVMLYGVFFVLGFICAYFVVWYALHRKARQTAHKPIDARKIATHSTDILCWLIIIGTIVGARLGHVLFYDLPYYVAYPSEIFKIWEGGLASHGAVVGIIIAIICSVRFLRKDFPKITFLNILDVVSLSVGIAAFWIRMGNFVNQEVIGNPTTVPWAIIFGHPMDGSAPVPRHPSQLYEAITYLVIFLFLLTLWHRKGEKLGPGVISGLLLILVFTARFFLDFLKVPQSAAMDESYIQMGQLLSIPFVLLGIGLLWYANRDRTRT
jgi:phosphatidylglycerol:prolipoprotein diacylglycerol transferase